MIRFYRVLVFCAGLLVSIDLLADSLLPLGAILYRSPELLEYKLLLSGHIVRQRGGLGQCGQCKWNCCGNRGRSTDSDSDSQPFILRKASPQGYAHLVPMGGDEPPEDNDSKDDVENWHEVSDLEKILELLSSLISSQSGKVRVWVMDLDGTLLTAVKYSQRNKEKKIFEQWKPYIKRWRDENKLILVYNSSRTVMNTLGLLPCTGLPEPDIWINGNGAVTSSTHVFESRYQKSIYLTRETIELPRVRNISPRMRSGNRWYMGRDTSSFKAIIRNNTLVSQNDYQQIREYLTNVRGTRLWERPPVEQQAGMLYCYNPQATKGSATRFVLETISSYPELNQEELIVTSFGDTLTDLSMMTDNLQFPEPIGPTTDVEPLPLPDNIRIEGAVVAHGSELVSTGTYEFLNSEMVAPAEFPGLPGLMKAALTLMKKGN